MGGEVVRGLIGAGSSKRRPLLGVLETGLLLLLEGILGLRVLGGHWRRRRRSWEIRG